MRRKHAMPSGVKALYEDLVARGELPDIKGLKREFRKRGEQALSNPSQSGSYEQKTEKPVAITPAEYSGLQAAFDHLNAALFNGKLPDIFITYQRRAHSGGYFGANRFADRGSKIDQHEIALNPDGFVGRTDEFIVSILHHEMCHLWQHMFGQHKSSRGYHNREWAAKMQATGLMPSSTGMVGGKTTGVRMQHYIIDGGPFSQAFAALAATGWKLNLGSAAHAGKPKSPPSKVPFTCPSCGWNVWGKPDTAVFCKPCWITTGGELIELRAKDAPSAGANPPAPAEAQAVVQKLLNRTIKLLSCRHQRESEFASARPSKVPATATGSSCQMAGRSA